LAFRKGITLINSPATIDWDYRGEIALPLINLGSEPALINRGDRVAQLVIAKVATPTLVIRDSLDETDRGTGGFGSTGL
jgi:dUTP pyrophosphatase